MVAHACKRGLEGIVSKRIDAPYRSGRARTWIKVRNKKAPAYTRIEDGTFWGLSLHKASDQGCTAKIQERKLGLEVEATPENRFVPHTCPRPAAVGRGSGEACEPPQGHVLPVVEQLECWNGPAAFLTIRGALRAPPLKLDRATMRGEMPLALPDSL